MESIDTDYLVIGTGTAGLAFADTLIDQTDAHVTLVDRHAKPGGHWNDAYPFVTLHQPSAFYGVNSMELGTGRKDTVGPNQGLYELASGAEVCSYFDRVMNHQLLPSGRVSYHPMCNHLGDSTFENMLSGRRTRVTVRKKVVDATYLSPKVPSTHTPGFAVGAGVRLVPPNALPQLWQAPAGTPQPRRFVVIGAGKTAMDACLWLMQAGASADAIQWVKPRDAWMVNRIGTQPAMEFFKDSIGGQVDQMEACALATSTADLFLRLEACGALLRIDPDRTPSMFHLGTITPGEAAMLREIKDVVRLGRVQALAADHLQLQHGRVPVAEGTLFVDCTASAVEPRALQPIFQPGRIVLQMVRLPQPAFSAALIAWVEAHGVDDKARNALCGTVPFPHTLDGYPPALLANMWNQFQWGQHPALRQWVRESRLDGFGKLMAGVPKDDAEKQQILARFKQHAMGAMANLQKLVAAGAGG